MKRLILCFVFLISEQLQSYAQDSIQLNYHLINDSIQFEFRNASTDTFYIFSSYLNPNVYFNKYLNRVSQKENTLNISLLPIISHVYTLKTDVIFSGDEQIIKPFQFIYEFISLAPGEKLYITLPFNEFKKNILNQNKVIVDFDPDKNFKKKCIRYLNKPQLASLNKIQFEFAVYQKITLLITKAAEANDSKKFVIQAKSYRIKTVQLPF